MATRLELKNGGWIEVKDKLKVRDNANIQSYSVEGIASDGKSYKVNTIKFQAANAAVRITNWSVTERGKAVEYPVGKSFEDRVAVIVGLDDEVFEPIAEALAAHFAEPEGEEKNEPSATEGGAIS